MITCSITSRLIVSMAIGFGIGALSSGLSVEAHDCSLMQQITLSPNAERSLPELAARFVVRRSGSKPTELHLARIGTIDIQADHGIAKTDPGAPNWLQLAAAEPSKWLEKLQRSGEKQLFGQTATHYRGQIGAENINLWWLEESRLPAQLLSRGPQGTLAVQLKELHSPSV